MFNGGNTPENSCHCVIDKPESVSLVKPPTTIISDTIKKIEINQYAIYLLMVVDDLNGKKLTFSGYLSSNVILDIGVNDDNYNGTDGFVKFTYLLGNNNINQNFTAEKVSANFSTDRNLKNHTLDKVKRQNDIIIQKRGGVVIGRTD